MRQFAHTVLFASITAVTSVTTFAATGDSTSPSVDKATGSPSVQANTANPQGMSYSDKSNTSPGTNAKMDTPIIASQVPAESPDIATDEHDRKMIRRMRAHKPNVAKDGDLDTTGRASIESTNGATANSTTGTSPGN